MSGVALVITLHGLIDLHSCFVKSLVATASDLVCVRGRVILVNAAPDDKELAATPWAILLRLNEHVPQRQ
jgi:hypothetical protein